MYLTCRKAVLSDCETIKKLFIDTVMTVNIADYTREETADWASCGENSGHWHNLIKTTYFITAFTADNILAGFAAIRNDGYLHSLFVSKDCQGCGVATFLLKNIENYAAANNIHEIISEVSITAKPYFMHKGYGIIKIQKRRANKLKLTNYVMKKRL